MLLMKLRGQVKIFVCLLFFAQENNIDSQNMLQVPRIVLAVEFFNVSYYLNVVLTW